jgi:hypothetical protein
MPPRTEGICVVRRLREVACAPGRFPGRLGIASQRPRRSLQTDMSPFIVDVVGIGEFFRRDRAQKLHQ